MHKSTAKCVRSTFTNVCFVNKKRSTNLIYMHDSLNIVSVCKFVFKEYLRECNISFNLYYMMSVDVAMIFYDVDIKLLQFLDWNSLFGSFRAYDIVTKSVSKPNWFCFAPYVEGIQIQIIVIVTLLLTRVENVQAITILRR